MDGTCGSRHAGAGPDYHAKKALADSLTGQVNALKGQMSALATTLLAQEASATTARHAFLRPQLAPIEAELSQARHRKALQGKELTSVTAGYDGPLARWDALGELAREHPAMRSFKFWFWLTLMFLDTSPALMKVMQLMGRKSAYEQAVDALELRAVKGFAIERDESEFEAEITAETRKQRRQSLIEIADLEAKKTVEVAKDRIDRETATEKEANRLLDDGQRARNLRDVDQWNEWLDPVALAFNTHRWEQWLDDLAAKQRSSSAAGWSGSNGQDFADELSQMLKTSGANKSTTN